LDDANLLSQSGDDDSVLDPTTGLTEILNQWGNRLTRQINALEMLRESLNKADIPTERRVADGTHEVRFVRKHDEVSELALHFDLASYPIKAISMRDPFKPASFAPFLTLPHETCIANVKFVDIEAFPDFVTHYSSIQVCTLAYAPQRFLAVLQADGSTAITESPWALRVADFYVDLLMRSSTPVAWQHGPRGAEIGALLALGLTDEQIAAATTRSRRTVARQVAALLETLGARSRLEAGALWEQGRWHDSQAIAQPTRDRGHTNLDAGN